MKRGSHVDVDDVERRKEGEASSAVKKEEVGEKPVEETPTANEARSDPGTAVTAGSATNQQAAETTPSAEPDVKEEAAENTPAAESTETPGETGVGRRNIKVYTHGERRGIETSSMEQRAMEENQAADAKGAGKTGSQLEALLESKGKGKGRPEKGGESEEERPSDAEEMRRQRPKVSLR